MAQNRPKISPLSDGSVPGFGAFTGLGGLICGVSLLFGSSAFGPAGAVHAASKSKPSATTTVAPKTPVPAGKSSAKTPKKSAKPLKPGTPFVGWAVRGRGDWPAESSALVLEPLKGSDTIVVYQKRGSGQQIALRARQSVSGDLGLLVVGEEAGWWKVVMPVRPNGTIGWVPREEAKARITPDRVVVDLSTNSLTHFRRGQVISTQSVATGTSGTPTPSGLFFVKAIVPQKNPAGGRGPFVLVLSGFSNVLNNFEGGQGAVGIHGTSAPGKIGQNVSHGCVRVPNEYITTLAAELLPGTPVEILTKPSEAPKTRWETPAVDGATASATESGSPTTQPEEADGAVGPAGPPATGI
jgi:hypothetical protein